MRQRRGCGPFRLVAVDVDGTLFDHSLVLDAQLLGWVDRLYRRGVVFTLATGRVFPSARRVAQDLGIAAPIITNGGAVVMAPGREAISHLTLAARQVQAVLEFSAGCPGWRYVLTMHTIASETDGEHAVSYARRLQVPVSVEPKLGRLEGSGVTQVVLRLPVDQAGSWESAGRARFGRQLTVTRSLPFMVEFFHLQATKGWALRRLADHLGVPPGQVLAVGDGINDLDMLEMAGCGVLVANADPTLWERADWVSASPYGRGVLEALARFIPEHA